jgi:2-amino-4-hydroxy-6-hydroxymethyldihydropteridine diphosphokinase
VTDGRQPAPGALAYIGLGANLGDARRTVEVAIDELNGLSGTTLLTRSSLYRSAPVAADGPDFVNAVACVRTTLAPEELLAALLRIEQHHGRRRSTPNAPRTLDLDLLLHGDRVQRSATLTLPHPRAHQRAFVLAPLAEIAPGLSISGHGPVAALLAALPPQRLDRLAP